MFIYIGTQFFMHLTAVQEIAFYGALVLSIGFIYRNGKSILPNIPFMIPGLLFLLWATLCIPFALNKQNTIHDIYAHLIKYYLFYLVITVFFHSKTSLIRVAQVYGIATTLFCIGGIIFSYLMGTHSLHGRLFMSAGMYIPYLEFLLELAVILCIQLISTSGSLYGKVLFLFCSLTIVTAIVLTQTRSAFLAVVAGLFIICIYGSKKSLVFIAILILLIPFTGLKERFFHEGSMIHNVRIGTIRLFTEVVKDYPISGIGFGMQTHQKEGFLQGYNAKLPPEHRPSEIVASPHNIFLDIAVRTGIPGLVLFLYLIGTIVIVSSKLAKAGSPFVKQWSIYIRAAFTAFFIQASFSDATFGRAAIVFYLICAIATVLLDIERKEHESSNRCCPGSL